MSRVARILDRRPNGAFKPNIFIQLYDSLVFDDKKTFSLEENRSQSLETSWKNCQLSYFEPFINLLLYLEFPLKFHSKKRELIERKGWR